MAKCDEGHDVYTCLCEDCGPKRYIINAIEKQAVMWDQMKKLQEFNAYSPYSMMNNNRSSMINLVTERLRDPYAFSNCVPPHHRGQSLHQIDHQEQQKMPCAYVTSQFTPSRQQSSLCFTHRLTPYPTMSHPHQPVPPPSSHGMSPWVPTSYHHQSSVSSSFEKPSFTLFRPYAIPEVQREPLPVSVRSSSSECLSAPTHAND